MHIWPDLHDVILDFSMAAWNPDEAQAAAIYLRLDDNELLTIRSKDFAGRSAVWVPSKEEGYVKATMLDKKAEKDGYKGKGLQFRTQFYPIRISNPFSKYILIRKQ